MNKKISKGYAFIFGMICILALFVVTGTLHFFEKATSLPVGSFLTAIVGLVTSYMGIDVVNNGVRGKCFNPEVAKLDAEQRGNNE